MAAAMLEWLSRRRRLVARLRRHDPWRVPGPDPGSVFVVGDFAEADEIDLTKELERSSQAVAGTKATLAAEAEAWDAEAREREAESEAYA